MGWSKLSVKGLASAMYRPNDSMHWDGLLVRRSLNQGLAWRHVVQGREAKAVLSSHQRGGQLLPSVLHQGLIECIMGIQAAAEVGRPGIACRWYVQQSASQPQEDDW
jgi:hypothetical protein